MKSRRLEFAVGFAVLMAFDTLAQVSFKLAGMHDYPPQVDLQWALRLFAAPWIYGAIAGYIGAFLTWMRLLKHAPIGPAFAASHLEVVSVMLISSVWFGEHVGPGKAVGAALVVMGIACLAKSESKAACDGG